MKLLVQNIGRWAMYICRGNFMVWGSLVPGSHDMSLTIVGQCKSYCTVEMSRWHGLIEEDSQNGSPLCQWLVPNMWNRSASTSTMIYQGLSAGVGAKTCPPGPHQKTVIFSGWLNTLLLQLNSPDFLFDLTLNHSFRSFTMSKGKVCYLNCPWCNPNSWFHSSDRHFIPLWSFYLPVWFPEYTDSLRE